MLLSDLEISDYAFLLGEFQRYASTFRVLGDDCGPDDFEGVDDFRIQSTIYGSVLGREWSRYRQMTDPELMLNNPFTNRIQAFAFMIAPELESRFQNIPLSTLPINDVNAFAYKLPSGRPFVNFNSAVNQAFRGALSLFSELWALLFAHMRGREIPRGRIGQCVRSFAHLALYIGTLDERHWGRHTQLCSDDIRSVNDFVSLRGMMINGFILLHEYGHLSHGDVIGADKVGALTTSSDFSEVRQSFRREYRADSFALDLFMKFFRDNPEDELFNEEHFFTSIGIFFNMLDLMNSALSFKRSRSHPEPLKRWNRIKAAYGPFELNADSPPGAHAIKRVDIVFELVKEQLPNVLPIVLDLDLEAR